MIWRELTDKEKRLIRMSVQKKCACYDPYYGCLPLDADCNMTKIGFTNSNLCRYYEKAVLPDEPEIMILLSNNQGKMRTCKICGRRFVMNGNRQYCSDHCSLIARRNATARRMRKARKNRDAM